MVIKCPHCGKQLKTGDKFIQSVKALPEGEKAKVKCTQCAKPFRVDNSMLTAGGVVLGKIEVKPPGPPDLSWLESGLLDDEEIVEELPLVMLLIKNDEKRAAIAKAFEDTGYRVETAATSSEAIEKMQFVIYAAVVLHEDFEPGDIRENPMHQYMSGLSMSRRRQLLYVLVGTSFHTMYDLEALSYSANMVVNDKELPKFSILLRKAVVEYEALFGPIIEELNIAGKS